MNSSGDPIKKYHTSVTGLADYQTRDHFASKSGFESLRSLDSNRKSAGDLMKNTDKKQTLVTKRR